MDYEYFDIEDWIKIGKIGEGASSKVYKVREKKSGLIFAAKIMKDESYSNPESKEYKQLKQEIDVVSTLKHPTIVKYIGFSPIDFRRQKKPMIITEYLQNYTLDKILEDEKKSQSDPNWNDTKKLISIYGIALAMKYLHANKIIHRDLKPDNILMGDNLFPKVADFGLSKKVDQITQTVVSIKGTPKYIAPEVYNTYTYTTKCDVYAYGLIVYEIYHGIEELKSPDLYKRIYEKKRPKINDNISKSYRKLITECWSHDPKARPSFDKIVENLETDRGFITNLINEDEFIGYQDYINNPNLQNLFDDNYGSFSLTSCINQTKLLVKKSAFKIEKVEESPTDELFIKATQYYEGKGVKTDKEKAAYYYKLSAENENIEAMTNYAEMLYFGDGIQENKEEAIKYFKNASEKGCAKAMVYYGDILIEQNKTKEAIELYKSASENDNFDGMSKYADFLYNGEFVEQNKFKAIMLYKRAADNDHKESIIKIFNILNSSNNSLLNSQDDVIYIKKAADLGNVEAMNKYADIIFNNNDLKEEAAIYYKKAADKDSPYGIYKYAEMLYNGFGVIQNQDKAIQLFEKAIEKNQLDAVFAYGKILFNSEIPGSKDESIRYIKRAADSGHLNAMKFYAEIFDKGEFVGENKKEATNYYKKAADEGDSEAIIIYSNRLIEGIGVDSCNKNEAISYLENSANKNNFEAMFHLAKIYDEKGKTSEDFKKAAKYYKIAADEGQITKAMNNLAILYENGKGVIKNLKEAARYLKLAADLNDLDALNNYALFLYSGKGVKENKVEAARYFKLAADAGLPSAMNNYANMLNEGIGIEQDKSEAFDYYKKGANKGDVFALYNYAIVLENGEFDSPDPGEVKKYLKEAAEKGHIYAAYRYAMMLLKENEILKENKKDDDDDSVSSEFDPVKENANEALKYLKMAADKGHPKSMYQYGRCTYFGIDTEKDEIEGYIYVKKAYNKGYNKANGFLNCLELDKSCTIC